MAAKLVGIAGRLEGIECAVDERGTTIGRLSSNDFPVHDLGVADRHCVVKQTAGRFIIDDVDQRRPTLINGYPAAGQSLEHGDRVVIGNAAFVFLLDDHPVSPSGIRVDLSDEAPARGSVLKLHREALWRKSREDCRSRLETREAHDLAALLRITGALSSVAGLAGMDTPLLELILEAIPATRGAVLFTGPAFGEFGGAIACGVRSASSTPLRISRDLLHSVLDEGVGVLYRTDALSVAAAPLLGFERPIGLLYLEVEDAAGGLDEHHLRLLMAIAAATTGALEQLHYVEQLQDENRRLRHEVQADHRLVGESPAMHAVYTSIQKVARVDATVLLLGESGTGKELAARAIHQASRRAGKPFAAINCAALPPSLIESELFGHERGAFTGAMTQKLGKLEAANGGSVFLDEIVELPLESQAKLLRVLQEREVERVGGTRCIPIDVRFLAATNRNIAAAVRTGAFRADLYYRLDVLPITLPPLRDRPEDIPILATYFASKYAAECKRRIRGVSPNALRQLGRYSWPGNVRELQNVIERAVVLMDGDWIERVDLAVPPASVDVGVTEYHSAVRDARTQIVARALERTGGSYTKAAALLGIHPNNLRRLARVLGVRSAATTRSP
jgi:transcriptional regulator with GAF, ATPase, and Fis domain